MTVLPQLERQLIRAAERATKTHRRHGGQRSARARTVAGGFALVMAAAVTVVIGVGALILIGSHKRSTADRAAAPGSQQLTAIIGVLRRPQTKADLNQKILSQLPSGLIFQGKPDLPLVRFATTTPWGERLYFVPIKPLTTQQLASLRHLPHLAARDLANLRTQGETLSVFSSQGGGGAANAARIEAGQALGSQGAGRAFAGGATRTKLILVVPDGVAKVQFVLPRQPQPNVPGTHIYPSSTNVTVRVHGNVAAAEVPRNLPGVAVPMIWYSPDGAVLKRFGNLAAVNRVVAPPQPGPETPQSRAAERNPSTPNRVWVTPAVGNQHAKYAVHFRLLLNGADYRFQMSGTRCPQITFAGGGGGGYGDLRGRILSYDLDAVTGQTWCPGIYHLSATVMDLAATEASPIPPRHSAQPRSRCAPNHARDCGGRHCASGHVTVLAAHRATATSQRTAPRTWDYPASDLLRCLARRRTVCQIMSPPAWSWCGVQPVADSIRLLDAGARWPRYEIGCVGRPWRAARAGARLLRRQQRTEPRSTAQAG